MKNKFLQLIKSKSLFFVAIVLVIFSLNLTPLIAHVRNSPKGRTFALLHNNAQDYFFYQALMNKGANGDFLTTDPYTSEPHKPSIIFAYFLWLGKISKILGLPYAITYHFARIVLGILFLLVSYLLLLTFSFPYPRLTFFFFVFASPLLHKIHDSFGQRIIPFMNWWTGMDAVRRVAYLPHHMFGGLSLVTSIILLIKFFNFKKHSLKPLILALLLIPLMAFVHTPSLFILLLILPPTALVHLLIQFLKSSKKSLNVLASKLLSRSYYGLFTYWLAGLLCLFFMVAQTKGGFPWSQYLDWEKKLQFPLIQELPKALGILLPFSILGIYKALRTKRFEAILAVSWLFVPFLFIPFSQKLNFSNIRLIQGVPYLPLAILACFGIEQIKDILNSIAKLHLNKVSRKVNILLYLAIISLFLFLTIPTIRWSVKDQIREYMPIFGNVYFDNRLNYAFSFIDNNFPPKPIVLTTFYSGNYLPAFSNAVSFVGHSGYTYNVEEKTKLADKFFRGKMSENEAGDFLMKYNIDIVFQGPEEKPLYNGYLYPNLLKTVYDKQEATIYTMSDGIVKRIKEIKLEIKERSSYVPLKPLKNFTIHSSWIYSYLSSFSFRNSLSKWYKSFLG